MPSYLPVGSLGPAFHKGIAHVPVRDKGTGGDHRGNASFPMEDRRLRQASGGMGAGAPAAAGAPGRRHGIGRGRVLRWMGEATQCAADGARTRLHRSLLRFWAAGRRRWRPDANPRGRVATAGPMQPARVVARYADARGSQREWGVRGHPRRRRMAGRAMEPSGLSRKVAGQAGSPWSPMSCPATLAATSSSDFRRSLR